jgi:hypothetical protein
MALDLEKINDSDHLLDMLIQIEDVLDSLDVFCYANWFDGEIIEGPIVRRYWVTVSILYPNDKMPDPRAALRLLKHGVQVEFDRMQRAAPQAAPGQEQASPTQGEWLIRLSIPRLLLDQNEEIDLEEYEDDINPDDVVAAKDTGMDDESALHTDEQVPGMPGPDGQMPPPAGGQPPPPMPPA